MSEANNEAIKPKIKFRNYTPYDTSLLSDKKEPQIKQTEGLLVKSTETKQIIEPTTTTTNSNTISLLPTVDPIQQELNNVILQIGNNNKELNIIPKKINWDLKRHSEYKIEKLRKRTQRVIVEMLREKLTAEGADAVGGDDTSDEDDD